MISGPNGFSRTISDLCGYDDDRTLEFFMTLCAINGIEYEEDGTLKYYFRHNMNRVPLMSFSYPPPTVMIDRKRITNEISQVELFDDLGIESDIFPMFSEDDFDSVILAVYRFMHDINYAK